VTVVDSIHRFLTDELRNRGSAETLTAETPLLESGILDSLTLMELLSHIEESFGIEIEPHEIVPENLATIRDIAAVVTRLRKSAPTS
jgi:acyl carrier protein